MPRYQPSPKMVREFLDAETSKALSLPLVALITGALSQVESTIELTNRVYDSVFQSPLKTMDSAIRSAAAQR